MLRNRHLSYVVLYQQKNKNYMSTLDKGKETFNFISKL